MFPEALVHHQFNWLRISQNAEANYGQDPHFTSPSTQRLCPDLQGRWASGAAPRGCPWLSGRRMQQTAQEAAVPPSMTSCHVAPSEAEARKPLFPLPSTSTLDSFQGPEERHVHQIRGQGLGGTCLLQSVGVIIPSTPTWETN